MLQKPQYLCRFCHSQPIIIVKECYGIWSWWTNSIHGLSKTSKNFPPNSVSQTHNKTEAALETSWFSKKIWPWKEFTKSRSVFCVTGKMKCCVTSSFEGMYSACYHAPVKTTVPELGKVRAAVCCAPLFSYWFSSKVASLETVCLKLLHHFFKGYLNTFQKLRENILSAIWLEHSFQIKFQDLTLLHSFLS